MCRCFCALLTVMVTGDARSRMENILVQYLKGHVIMQRWAVGSVC